MLVSKLIYYDKKSILPNAHQVKIIQHGGWNELHLVATKLNKLMIIFDIHVILLFFSITLFPNKNNFVTNNSKKIHAIC
jgi:hypothetical protein